MKEPDMNITPVTSLMSLATVIGFLSVGQVIAWSVQARALVTPINPSSGDEEAHSQRIEAMKNAGNLIICMWGVGFAFSSLLLTASAVLTWREHQQTEDSTLLAASLGLGQLGLFCMSLFGVFAYLGASKAMK